MTTLATSSQAHRSSRVMDHRTHITAIVPGGQVPRGAVRVSGAKNSATRLLAAALICDDPIVLENFPTELVDAQYKRDFIQACGGIVDFDAEQDRATIDASGLHDTELTDYNFPIRTTYLLVPGLIKRSGRARIPYPGGCKIGHRGYDLHLMVWREMGATVVERDGYIEVVAEGGFQPCEISFPISTIGGTENALISASTVEGQTTIRNAYISPEVDDLIQFLRKVGAKIEVLGNSHIRVTGTRHLIGAIHRVLPDRIEALTWIIYAALARGTVVIEDVPFEAMEIPLLHLRDAGIDYYRNSTNIVIDPACIRHGAIQPFEVATGTHPGIISDMQPFFVLLGLHADGISRIFDYRYPDRITYCHELSKFYRDMIQCHPGQITLKGSTHIRPTGAVATSTDLRGSMALLLAALLSGEHSHVHRADMAMRGYNKLLAKLAAMGITVLSERVEI